MRWLLAKAHERIDWSHLQALSSVGERSVYLVATYVEELLDEKKWRAPYSRDQALTWIAWLADQMQRHGIKVMQVDQMQPSWLASSPEITTYALASRTALALVAGIGMAWMIQPLLLFSIVGLALGGVDAYRFSRRRNRAPSTPTQRRTTLRRRLRSCVTVASTASVTVGLLAAGGAILLAPFIALVLHLVGGLTIEDVNTQNRTELLVLIFVYVFSSGVTGLLSGFIHSLPFLGILGWRNPDRWLQDDIGTVETLYWSWPGSARGALAGILPGFLVGLLSIGPWLALAFFLGELGLLYQGEHILLFLILTIGLFIVISALIGSLIGGIRSKVTELEKRDEGRQAKFNANFGGLIVGGIGGLIAGFVFGLSNATFAATYSSGVFGIPFSLHYGAIIGVAAGLLNAAFFTLLLAPIAWLHYGGAELIKGKALRWLLARSGMIPPAYEHFLDHMSAQGLLRKIGNGYAFQHETFQDYLASCNPKSRTRVTIR